MAQGGRISQRVHHPLVINPQQLIGGAHHIVQKLEQRQQHGEPDARDHPNGQYTPEGDERQPEGWPVTLAQRPEAGKIGEPQPGNQQNGPQGRQRNILQGRGQKQGTQCQQQGSHHRDQLALAATLFIDCRARERGADGKALTEPRRDIGQPQRPKLLIRIHFITIFGGKAAGREQHADKAHQRQVKRGNHQRLQLGQR